MFPKQTVTDSDLQEVATILKRKLTDDTVDADQFAKILDQYTKLIMLQHAERQQNKISKDVLATIVANLAGIGVIVGHERLHVVTSKALSFVMKLR